MATKGSNQKNQVKSSMLTKTGKTRLGPLSLKQLNDLLEKSSKPKEKNKITNRITKLNKILGVGKFKVVETLK
jgi:ribosomal protein L15